MRADEELEARVGKSGYSTKRASGRDEEKEGCVQ